MRCDGTYACWEEKSEDQFTFLISIITEAGTNKVDCFCLLESWIKVA